MDMGFVLESMPCLALKNIEGITVRRQNQTVTVGFSYLCNEKIRSNQLGHCMCSDQLGQKVWIHTH